jgi:SAM-dependent methyltransferase
MGSSEEKWPRYIAFEKTKNDKIIYALNDYLILNRKVLDVGCNTGMLLDYAKKRGCETHGVEPSIASRATLQAKGHASYEGIQDVSGGYDVITAFDLVEHLYDLPKFFRSMHALLNEDGVLIILTGNPQSLSAKISSNHWWYLKAPEHIVFPSLKYIESISGYKLINHIYCYASLGYERNIFISIAQLIRKKVTGANYVGLPSIGPDHFLAIMKKCNKSE